MTDTCGLCGGRDPLYLLHGTTRVYAPGGRPRDVERTGPDTYAVVCPECGAWRVVVYRR